MQRVAGRGDQVKRPSAFVFMTIWRRLGASCGRVLAQWATRVIVMTAPVAFRQRVLPNGIKGTSPCGAVRTDVFAATTPILDWLAACAAMRSAHELATRPLPQPPLVAHALWIGGGLSMLAARTGVDSLGRGMVHVPGGVGVRGK
jgi:hypothetical protein